MWLKDLQRAIDLLYSNPKYQNYLIQRIVPNGKCIAFFTTHYTIVQIYKDGRIEEIQP